MGFLKISEISSSVPLRIYGSLLSFTHLVTWFFWFDSDRVDWILRDPEFTCWSFFQSCSSFHQFLGGNLDMLSLLYFALSVGAAVFFVTPRSVILAWLFLFSATLLKIAVFVSDYRFMGNYHYMSLLVILVFLLSSQKKKIILYLIPLFYVSAGFLKLDTEWLYGASLLSPSLVQGEGLEWLLSYVIFFEIIGAFFLLSNRVWIFSFFFFQFIVFHIYSWHIVGYFYPSLMFLLLAAYPIFRVDWTRLKIIPIEKLSMVQLSVLTLFLLVNVLPRWINPDISVNSKGRLLTLNMLDARVHCIHDSYLVSEKQVVEISSSRQGLGLRVKCDPVMYFAEARKVCESKKPEQRLFTQLIARKHTQKEWKLVFRYENFCQDQVKMSWWGGFR